MRKLTRHIQENDNGSFTIVVYAGEVINGKALWIEAAEEIKRLRNKEERRGLPVNRNENTEFLAALDAGENKEEK